MNKPYDRIEARDDGYLWLVNFGDGMGKAEQQPLLLHAAANLMKQLKQKWHADIVFAADDDDVSVGEDENDEMEIEDEAEKDDMVVDDEDEKAEHQETDVLQMDDDNEKGEISNEIDPPQVDYQKLERVLNLSSKILTTIMHIRLYKHDCRKKLKRHNFKESRTKALQHQRDRLQQQKQQGQQDDKVAAHSQGSSDDADADANFQIDGKEQDDNDDDSDSNEPQDPHVRLVRTLNSVRAVFPVLQQMMFHKDRERKDLKVGPKMTILPKKRKESFWLLGKQVFDFAPAKTCKSIQMNLDELLEFFLPRSIVMDVIGGTVADGHRFWCNGWLPRTWALLDANKSIHLASPYDILAEYAEKELEDSKATIVKQCQICDKKFFAKQAEDEKTQSEHKQYQQAVNKLHTKLANILETLFPGSRLSIYGSCLSNLSVKGSDVDLSLYLPQAEQAKKSFQHGNWEATRYEKEMTKLVRDVWRRLVRRPLEFADMFPVTRARVPVVKGSFLQANNPYTANGALHFDICFLNDIAVANSRLLREYSLIDDSVRELMVVVKKFAKDNKVGSAQDNSLSSYAWLNLVVFYLQCLGRVPNLQCPKLMEQVGHQRDPKEYWHNVNDLDTYYLTFEQVKQVWKRPAHFDVQPMSHTVLLYGFFNFYAMGFLRPLSMVSIRRGSEEIMPKTVFRKCSPFFCIEDPFETFDSHMPHDLGIPVNEPQTRRILDLLRKAEKHLRGYLLEGDGKGKELISLWPWPSVETNKRNGQRKRDGGRRRGRGGENANGGRPKQEQGTRKTQQPNNAKQQQDNNPKQLPVTQGPRNDGGNSKPNIRQKQPGIQNRHNRKSKPQEAGQEPVEKEGVQKQQSIPPVGNDPNSGGAGHTPPGANHGRGGRGRGGRRRPRGPRGRGRQNKAQGEEKFQPD